MGRKVTQITQRPVRTLGMDEVIGTDEKIVEHVKEITDKVRTYQSHRRRRRPGGSGGRGPRMWRRDARLWPALNGADSG